LAPRTQACIDRSRRYRNAPPARVACTPASVRPAQTTCTGTGRTVARPPAAHPGPYLRPAALPAAKSAAVIFDSQGNSHPQACRERKQRYQADQQQRHDAGSPGGRGRSLSSNTSPAGRWPAPRAGAPVAGRGRRSSVSRTSSSRTRARSASTPQRRSGSSRRCARSANRAAALLHAGRDRHQHQQQSSGMRQASPVPHDWAPAESPRRVTGGAPGKDDKQRHEQPARAPGYQLQQRRRATVPHRGKHQQGGQQQASAQQLDQHHHTSQTAGVYLDACGCSTVRRQRAPRADCRARSSGSGRSPLFAQRRHRRPGPFAAASHHLR
jgi:hypothetical protein